MIKMYAGSMNTELLENFAGFVFCRLAKHFCGVGMQALDVGQT